MNREKSVDALRAGERWDIAVIGGGATGLSAALDAAARGYRTVLIEAHDFAKATSSRSTKLIHGGVRYLRQGNVSLVRDSLRERAFLLRNAPSLTRRQAFIVPAYRRMDRPFYGIGLKLYDALAGRLSLGPSTILSRHEVLREAPATRAAGLRGGVRYFDGQFDDARLAVSLAQSIHDAGGVAVNYVRAEKLLKEGGKIAGLLARDAETGMEFELRARVVINATGVFTDAVRKLDESQTLPLVTASQGAHIVVDQKFLPGPSALMVPKTKDGRVLFAIPWMGRVLIGTTDTPVNSVALEPKPLAAEVEFLLEHAAIYLEKAPSDSDILSVFAGLRPLVKAAAQNTASLSRDHAIFVSDAGLVTIVGGKWTTCRKMGEDVVTRAAEVASLPRRECRTRTRALHAAPEPGWSSGPSPELAVRAAREEMARTVEDVLARRARTLMVDARAAMDAAPVVADALRRELGRDAAWQQAQIESFRSLARDYLWHR